MYKKTNLSLATSFSGIFLRTVARKSSTGRLYVFSGRLKRLCRGA